MEVWPSGFAVQAESPNHRKLRRSRAVVVSVSGKGPARPGQASDEKTNMCKPLQTHRNKRRRRRNRGLDQVLGTKASGNYCSPSARELPARGPGGVRCIGGVSSSQALAWNRRTSRLDTDGQHKWVKSAPWSREGGPRAAETARGRVPRGTGAERPAVVTKAL
jgi:hypothetical protein